MSPSTSGDAALSVPVSTPPHSEETVPTPVPLPVPKQGEDQAQAQAQSQAQAQVQAQAQGLGHEQGLVPASAPSRVAVPRVPDGMMPPADGDEARAAGVLSTPTTPVPSIENQNDKWPRAPVSASASASAVSKRPNGPSLLTQRLAEARGIFIPVTGPPLDASTSTPSSRLQEPPYDLPVGTHPRQDPIGQGSDPTIPKSIADPAKYDDSDGDSLTPRASPRAIAMATTAAVSTLSLSPRVNDTFLSHTLDTSTLGDAEPRLRSHRDLFRPSGRGMSLERTDKERRLKELAFTSRTYSDTSMPPTMTAATVSERESTKVNARLDLTSMTGQPSPTRPRKPDHRVSMGPEKVWSIGSEDLNNAQDGLVEKSIAEVLAGVEPNARSRKASHSLRFFKEGLPEEKSKTRDSRLGPKEKLPLTDDVLHAVRGGDQAAKSLQPTPGSAEDCPARLTRTKTFPLPSSDTHYEDDAPLDYFQLRPRDKDHSAAPTSLEDKYQAPESPGAIRPAELKQDEEERHGATSDVAVEDGELSGEEKISSAVFVPHKAPQDAPAGPEEPEHFDAPVKPHQRNDDGSSWLVKADEPEADDPGTPDIEAADEVRDPACLQFEARHLAIADDQQTHAVPVQPIFTEFDLSQQNDSRAPHVVSPGYGDLVHDHQQSPSEPLDAIELVPYRHQVGGHTTLWRFSKRAVCKQLNNRENEFYEQIEKYHRDLLPFLPRYVPLRSEEPTFVSFWPMAA